MGDREVRANSIAWAVFTAMGVQMLLGGICLWLGIRGNPFETFLGMSLCLVAVGFGIATYRRRMRGESISLMPMVVAIAAFVLFFWVTGTGRFGP